jgi:hypothetical protein
MIVLTIKLSTCKNVNLCKSCRTCKQVASICILGDNVFFTFDVPMGAHRESPCLTKVCVIKLRLFNLL